MSVFIEGAENANEANVIVAKYHEFPKVFRIGIADLIDINVDEDGDRYIIIATNDKVVMI